MKITHRKVQQNGMALGGIGTGSVEICENGELLHWDIFNLGKWADREADKHGKSDLYDYDRHVLPFFIRTQQGSDLPKFRKLSHDTDDGEFRSVMYSWSKEVKDIAWDPQFPICRLNYLDDSLPVSVSAAFSSVFIPQDARASATPGFAVTFTVENTSDAQTTVSLMGKLKNPINRGLPNRQLQNILRQTKDHVSITMQSSSLDPAPQNGSLCFGAKGGEISYIQSDFADFFKNYVLNGDFGTTEQSYLFDFRDTGRLPNLGMQQLPLSLLELSDQSIRALSDSAAQALLEQCLQLASANAPYQRICDIDASLLQNRENRLSFLCLLKNNMQQLAHDQAGQEAWGDAALCSTITLAPNEKKELSFFVSWHFPNHLSENGTFVGHQYANWFEDAAQVNEYLMENAPTLLQKTQDFALTLRDTTVPPSFVQNWCNHLNTIVKCSWWSKSGDFAIWEGYGSCGFHTMDITYQGSFNLLALFPTLQLSQMEMGAKFQRADGRVHHFFTPDFTAVDNGFDRVDMNPQFVLLVCRDYLWTGDVDYLKRLWKPVVAAMDSIEKLDENGDGLPDQETASNTYDAWHFKGTPSYIASLWLACLLAAGRMAKDLGQTALAQKWDCLLQKGSQSFLQTLWNGEYFSLWVDGQTRDECCMADQIDGQWYAQLLDLGEFIPKEQIVAALRAVLKYNYHEETGLQNAIYPQGCKPTLFTYQNVQALSNWSGIEFAFASSLLENQLTEPAARLSSNVEQRYAYAGRIFNHQECGDHYYRAMASWALLLSLTGFKLDTPRKTVTLAPSDCMKAPWFAPSGYGSFTIQPDSVSISCKQGKLCMQKLHLRASRPLKSITMQEQALCFTQSGDQVCVDFKKELRLSSGETLTLLYSE